MQAGFGFVKHHEFRWAWRKESSGPEKIAQGSVGELGCGERTQESMLLQL